MNARNLKAAETRRRNQEADARMEEARAITRSIVEKGVCPCCGRPLVRNSALAGWWQCSQLGAETHRADPSQPSCNWQGFTE